MNNSLSIIAIGDELLIGQVIDTNSGNIARIIEPAGWSLDQVTVVHDSSADISHAIEEAFRRSQVVVTTGGLGPTKDDITKQVMCNYFGGELREDPAVLENVKEVFHKRNLDLNKLTAGQAMVPTSCRVIQNRVGTAPIMWFERPDGKVLVAMPGVPFEAIQMFENEVFPQLQERFPSDVAIGHRCVILSGITESDTAEMLDQWERELPDNLHLAYLPKQGVIRLRIDGTGHDHAALETQLDRAHDELKQKLAQWLLADRDLSVPEILLERLRSTGHTVSSAESCTGGNLAHSITMISGCSDVYYGSVVSYSNEVKIKVLGVSADTIDEYGVVSEPVVRQMAEGVCRAIGTTSAMATSGIAGPGGATPGKPVGTVCIAVTKQLPDGKFDTFTHTYHFPGARDRVIDRATTTALTLLIKHLSQ